MRRSQPSPEHAEAVSRRLATLSAELASVRGDGTPAGGAPAGGWPSPDWDGHTRIRGEPVAPPSAPQPVAVPVPGRHASRRLSDKVPGLGFVAGLQPVHLALVAVVAALAVGLAAWLAVRDQATPVPAPEIGAAESPLASVAPTADTAPTPADAAASEVTVDVAGKVRSPGIAVLPAGSRVVDALEAAGGARRGVDLTSLNLARPLVDGEQVLVGLPAPTGVAGSLATPGSPGPAGGLVNLNSADQATLETLPGVGPVTATSIIQWRTDNGGFTAVDELLEVDGIGEATLADLAPHVTI